MKKFQVPFHLVENGACRDMLANVNAETRYQAALIVSGNYVSREGDFSVFYGTNSCEQSIHAYVDYDGIREVIDI